MIIMKRLRLSVSVSRRTCTQIIYYCYIVIIQLLYFQDPSNKHRKNPLSYQAFTSAGWKRENIPVILQCRRLVSSKIPRLFSATIFTCRFHCWWTCWVSKQSWNSASRWCQSGKTKSEWSEFHGERRQKGHADIINLLIQSIVTVRKHE